MHVLAARTTALDVSQCLDTNAHKQSQSSQQKPASSQQSRTCWTFARPMPRYAVTVTCGNRYAGHKKIFCPLNKRFSTQYRMRYAIYIPPNTKDLTINLTKVAYGNRQNAITFAWANNSDLLRALKHFMETRLYD